jgi:glycosyltransferase involved in cell wall biosynthesis
MVQQDDTSSICLIIPSLNIGGAERAVLNMGHGLINQGHVVHLIVISSRHDDYRDFIPASMHVHELGKGRVLSALGAMILTLRKIKPDYVLSTMGYLNFMMALIRVFLPHKTKLIFREANIPSSTIESMSSATFGRWGYRYLYRMASIVLCNSRHVKDGLIEEGVFADKIHLLENPVDVGIVRRFAMMEEDQMAVDMPVVLENRPLHFIFVGRLSYQKGLDRLFTALAEDQDSWRYQITLIGAGAEEKKLKAQVEALNLQDHIQFLGVKENPWGYMLRADALILPSRWEGLPNVALEALTLGLPVIATNETGALPDLMDDVQEGYLIIRTAGARFIEAMKQQHLRYDLAHLGANKLSERFHLENVVTKFKALL